MRNMKNILKISLVLSILFGVISCNMDKFPPSQISSDDDMTVQDIEKFRVGFYTALRGFTSGSNIYAQEQQSDLFHATIGYGNRGGQMYNWMFSVSDGDVQNLWGSAYSCIGNINYAMQKAQAIKEMTDAERTTLKGYLGEAYFLRAYYHHALVMAFCLPYSDATKDSYGVPYVTRYAPTSDNSTYPVRGTLEEAYQKIMEDIDSAAVNITAEGSSANSKYITRDAVTALRARVALHYGDYATAIEAANSLLPKYPLAADAEEMKKMWREDDRIESILQLTGTATSLPGNLDAGYIGENVSQKTYTPDYVPEQWLIDLYDQDNDLRFAEFFLKRNLTLQGSSYAGIFTFNKFDCNPAFNPQTSDRNYNHENRIFRIAEMHLILAEAYARSGQESQAQAALTTFMQKRNPAAANVTAIGKELLNEILKERTREFVGEGFRLNDLRRFQTNIVRGAAQNEETVITVGNKNRLEESYANYRATWPIPQAEIDANPQLRSQQNEGYN